MNSLKPHNRKPCAHINKALAKLDKEQKEMTTSGLDGEARSQVLHLARELANEGKAVLAIKPGRCLVKHNRVRCAGQRSRKSRTASRSWARLR